MISFKYEIFTAAFGINLFKSSVGSDINNSEISRRGRDEVFGNTKIYNEVAAYCGYGAFFIELNIVSCAKITLEAFTCNCREIKIGVCTGFILNAERYVTIKSCAYGNLYVTKSGSLYKPQ